MRVGRRVHLPFFVGTKPRFHNSNFSCFSSVFQKSGNTNEKLVSALNKAVQQYENAEETDLDDSSFDALLEHLGPGMKTVGASIPEELPRSAHSEPMLSLANTYDEKGIKKFCEGVQKEARKKGESNPLFIVEPKYDGLAISLIYENGKLVRGVTRGDGTFGKQVTDNLRALAHMPVRIPETAKIEVRGELVVPLSAFEEYSRKAQETGEGVPKHPRSLVAGLLNRKDCRHQLKFLDVIPYHLSQENHSFRSYSHMLSRAIELGFKRGKMDTCSSVGDVLRLIKTNASEEGNYPTDGSVIKVDDTKLRDDLGSTSTAPRWAIAYKSGSKRVVTKLKDITLQVGRTGKITPVGELERVQLSGSNISRVTLHNFHYLRNLALAPGTTVIVEKAGDVIPKIVHSFADSTQPCDYEQLMCQCKEPHQLTPRGTEFYCEKEGCTKREIQYLKYVMSRSVLDISGMGEATLQDLVDSGLVQKLTDVFELEQHKEKLVELNKWGEKKVKKLLENIQKGKEKPINLSKFLVVLGIHNIAAQSANSVAAAFDNHFDHLLNNRQNISLILAQVPGIGPTLANDVHSFFNDSTKLSQIRKLKQCLNVV